MSNAARIYRVIYKDENSNDFYDTIKEMYLFGEYEELTNEELDLLFLTLKIPLNSNGTNYIKRSYFWVLLLPWLTEKIERYFYYNWTKTQQA